MSLHAIDCNDKESQRPSLCREIVITKTESKKPDISCLAGQMVDNQNKDGSCRLDRQMLEYGIS